MIEFGQLVMIRPLAALLLSLTLIAGLSAQKKKNKKDEEPPTQVLPALPEPPEAVAAETARLSFQVSPLSNKGLLSQQIRDALKVLLRDSKNTQIVKLRAFVAGSGDLRRVQTIMVEEFTERKLAARAEHDSGGGAAADGSASRDRGDTGGASGRESKRSRLLSGIRGEGRGGCRCDITRPRERTGDASGDVLSEFSRRRRAHESRRRSRISRCGD